MLISVKFIVAAYALLAFPVTINAADLAQPGVGMQFSDAAGSVAGANCYACHQLSGTELSFGTIGPSLRNFGKLRGNSEAIQRYAYGKIYNSQAYSACSNMPRFGHSGI